MCRVVLHPQLAFRQFLEDELYKTLLPKPPIVVLSDMVAPKEVILTLGKALGLLPTF